MGCGCSKSASNTSSPKAGKKSANSIQPIVEVTPASEQDQNEVRSNTGEVSTHIVRVIRLGS